MQGPGQPQKCLSCWPRLGWNRKPEGFSIGLHRIALRFPSRRSSCEELDSAKAERQRAAQNYSAGLISRTGTVNNDIFIFRNERGFVKHVLRRNPLRAQDKLRIGQEIEGLTNIKEKSLLARHYHRLQLLNGNAVPI